MANLVVVAGLTTRLFLTAYTEEEVAAGLGSTVHEVRGRKSADTSRRLITSNSATYSARNRWSTSSNRCENPYRPSGVKSTGVR